MKASNSAKQSFSLHFLFIIVTLCLYSGATKAFYCEAHFESPSELAYGLEAEINITENPNIINYYRPVEISESDWRTYSREKKLQIAKESEANARYAYHKVIYKKLSTSPEFLQDTLESEGNGNVELNGFVFNYYSEYRIARLLLENTIGVASLQAHVSLAGKRLDALEGSAGYSIFSADMAQFTSLEVGFQKYLGEPLKRTPGLNLSNYSLGPLSDRDRQMYINNEERALSRRDLLKLGTSRIVYGSILRGDIYGPSRVGFELRQFHKRGKPIDEHVFELRNLLLSDAGLGQFKKFENSPLISTEIFTEIPFNESSRLGRRPWGQFVEKVREFYDKDPDFYLFDFPEGGGAPISQRFLLPLRALELHPLILELPKRQKESMHIRIELARSNYIKRVEKYIELSNSSSNAQIDGDTIRGLQIAISQWAFELGIGELFTNHWKNTLRGDSEVELTAYSLISKLQKVDVENEQSAEPQTESNPIPHVKLDRESNSDDTYLELRDSSFEVVVSHQRSLEYDHLVVRIGDKRYDFNPDFSGGQVGKGNVFEVRPGDRTGFLFVRSPEKIKALQALMDRFVVGFNEHSFPPFATEPDWKDMRISSTDEGLNYFEILGRRFAMAPNGVPWPVEHEVTSGVLNVEEVSCASSIIGLLNEYFGFKLYLGDGWEADARAVGQHLLKGNPGGTPPDAIVHY